MTLCILLAPLLAIAQDLLNGVFGLLVVVGVEPPDLYILLGPALGCP